ncbi:DUF7504 family protein [Halorarius halobius]|uniref:DUF7504 family protein n=1 Tax=Halorarius halobius TaxID=2962671 RepID=UPI0020CEB935|nr:hypothetical protein [Halorarius halobius]
MGPATTEACTGDTDSPPLPDEGASVLVLAPSMSRDVDACCVGLACREDPADANLLAVELDGTVDDVVGRWDRHCGRTPARTAVVTAGESTRSAAAAAGGESMSLPGSSVSVTSVSSPGDLTGLGIKVSQCLTSWDDADGELALCFRSLTTLLQFAELERVFQFVHLLTQRVEASGARAHFHMDPNAHDDQTVATLRSLFDDVRELGPDGEWRRR